MNLTDHMKKSIQVYVVLAILEGVFSLIWLLFIPSDPKNAWVFGYSRLRFLLFLVIILGIAVFVGILLKSIRDSRWIERVSESTHAIMGNTWVKTAIWSISIIVLYLAVICLWIAGKGNWPYWVEPALKLLGVYLTRLAPVVFWAAAFSLQILIFLWLMGYRVRLGVLISQIFSFLICPSLMVYFFFLNEETYRNITKEDRIIEWLTVIFFLLTALAAIVHMSMAKRGSRAYVWFFTLMVIACCFFALEEISWGQRIFRFVPSDFFLEHSDQPEVNIHNVINEQFSVRTKHVAAWSMSIYGVVLPLFTLNKQVRSYIKRAGIVIPPLILIPSFILAALLTWDRFFTGQDEEVAEFFFSLLLFLVMVLQFWEFHLNPLKNNKNLFVKQ